MLCQWKIFFYWICHTQWDVSYKSSFYIIFFKFLNLPPPPSMWFIWIYNLMLLLLLIHNDVLVCVCYVRIQVTLCFIGVWFLHHHELLFSLDFVLIFFCSMHYLHASVNLLTKHCSFIILILFTHTKSNIIHHS
jgi:hypothetical protein